MNKPPEPPLRQSLGPSLAAGDPAAGRRAYWPWVVAVLLAVAAWFAYRHWMAPAAATADAAPAAQKGRRGADPSRPTPVVAAAARTGDINIYQDGLGTVTPVRTVTVKSRVDGELVKVLFREGQTVKAGDLLAEVDPRPYQVQLCRHRGSSPAMKRFSPTRGST